MQVTETLNEGLKREIQVMVPMKDLEAKLNERLDDTKGKIKLNGFRPGKVPSSYLRKMYGKSFMAEVLNEIINDAPRSILVDRNERSAVQPQIDINEDQKVLDGEADFIFNLKYEVLPEFEIKDFKDIEITREIADVSEQEIDEEVKKILSSTRSYSEGDAPSEEGDRVTIDYLGKIDDVPFDGGTGHDVQLVLGSNQFIPGFEEQLVGVKAGDTKAISVKFPDNYGVAHLAGKDAVFNITVKTVSKPDELKIDDEAAKKLGLESLDRLREVVQGQIENQYGLMTRQKIKRQILDSLDADYNFEIPERLVEIEFNNIWAQVNSDLQKSGRSFEDENTTEEKAREEYHMLAQRRVRLGLVLSEIGMKANIQVSESELQTAIFEQVRQYPGQEKEIMNFFRRTPEAIANLRAPIFEEKVIDYLLTHIKIKDKKVTVEELMKEFDESDAIEKSLVKKKTASDNKKSNEIKKKSTMKKV
ncbi:trigger factor [Bartonella bacilliformis Peru38]|uniref:Trigger factor n=2 Tax=Bartonella bacilliformis TaxID=774 RepID=TIG_BARBK|nr:trigger factor [Bartonella bacilliformis]A1USB3.1 RecName: Full=Trigger factor; Short=TF; AltName: Full=PPIase [Bartonella bacilliformis KC583]ABM45428.1 trigger factor [Bartonella bacilliformis KC583]AMG85691.1 trigger factor [Bartonella bacilliformis]EKS44787.1 trigger factor [Bartonella bacilliformis INS]EYS90010.1 trigger factor [Bartonella bacilliformis San Pedro600-02]EYS95088.1 trigger factor [Bartonella bacilliformis Peru-18]